jgi:hypothetical protein
VVSPTGIWRYLAVFYRESAASARLRRAKPASEAQGPLLGGKHDRFGGVPPLQYSAIFCKNCSLASVRPVRGRQIRFMAASPAAVKRQVACTCMYLHVPATLSLSGRLKPTATGEGFQRQGAKRQGRKEDRASASCGTGMSRQSLATAGAPWRRRVVLSPLPWPAAKCQRTRARERRTWATLPRFDGNATFIFC